jgi:anti-sigma factor RsiW
LRIDEPTLLAYIDGELPPERLAEVEDILARDPELAHQAALLRASRLPYRAAYDSLPLPRLPDAVEQRVRDLVQGAAGRASAARGPRRLRVYAMAAAVAGALIVGTLAMQRLGIFGEEAPPAWVQAVVDYQRLYVRETVGTTMSEQDVRRVLGELRARHGLAVRIPNLDREGFALKRVQQLGFEQRPLVQMVFLADYGDPVALCALASTEPDRAVRVYRAGPHTAVFWVKDRLAWVLVGTQGPEALRLLAERILSQS